MAAVGLVCDGGSCEHQGRADAPLEGDDSRTQLRGEGKDSRGALVIGDNVQAEERRPDAQGKVLPKSREREGRFRELTMKKIPQASAAASDNFAGNT